MGIGTSMKETTLHYYKDPLLEIVTEDRDVNLMGIMIYGSSDLNENKLLVAERVGVYLEAMRADGAIFSCNGDGNNHIDYAHAIEETEKRGIPVVALSLVPLEEYVVQNEYMDDLVCFYKTYDKAVTIGDETTALAENAVSQIDVRKALARLKLKMRKDKYKD